MSNGLILHYHFLGGSKRIFEPIRLIMGLAPPTVTEGTGDFYFFEASTTVKLEQCLSWLKTKYRLMLPESGWTRYKNAPGCFWEHERTSQWIIPVNFQPPLLGDNYYEHKLRVWAGIFLYTPTIMAVQKQGALYVHGALVSWRGQGLAILASSGTGKSTTCNRLPTGWEVHADDQMLLFQTESGEFRAHGLPTWSRYFEDGKIEPYNVSESVPLKALLFLERADRNRIEPEPLSHSQASAGLFAAVIQVNHTYWRSFSQAQKVRLATVFTDRSTEFTRKINTYRFQLSLGGAFWRDLEYFLENRLYR